MSKLDAQRAMREAKWARTQERAASTPRSASPRPPVAPPAEGDAARPARKTVTAKAASRTAAPTDTPADEGALCNHASMNGRTCTRPAGHSQKSHRYS